RASSPAVRSGTVPIPLGGAQVDCGVVPSNHTPLKMSDTTATKCFWPVMPPKPFLPLTVPQTTGQRSRIIVMDLPSFDALDSELLPCIGAKCRGGGQRKRMRYLQPSP